MSVKSPQTGKDAPAAMDQVRDLLFGTQIKEIDTRLQRQEERFARSVEDAKAAMKGRIESLENFMKSEVASMLSRLKQEASERAETVKMEQRERQEAVTQLAKELAAANDELERKLAKLSAALDATERELRGLLQTESTMLGEKIQESYQGALAVLGSTAAQIRADMVHRATLAGMFTETAVKLNGEWTAEVEDALRGENAAEAANG